MSPKHGEFLVLEYLTWEPRTNNNNSIPHHPLPTENSTFVVCQKNIKIEKQAKIQQNSLKNHSKIHIDNQKNKIKQKKLIKNQNLIPNPFLFDEGNPFKN